jgi:DNA-binding HxlR family transcriptional regulator
LDKIGECWTILLIRELTAGPRRFTDLVDGQQGIIPNLLAE